jgi:hypothetical protein
MIFISPNNRKIKDTLPLNIGEKLEPTGLGLQERAKSISPNPVLAEQNHSQTIHKIELGSEHFPPTIDFHDFFFFVCFFFFSFKFQ